MKYKRVLLVAIPIQDVTRPPAAMPILASCCNQAGSDYKFLDLNLHMHSSLPVQNVESVKTDFVMKTLEPNTVKDFAVICEYLHEQIDEYQPDLIAISVFTFESIPPAILVLNFLNQRSDRSNFHVVLGGLGVGSECTELIGPGTFGQWIQAKNLAEFVITGEGEYAFTELLKGNVDYPGINLNPPQQILDLDPLPSPDYSKIDPKHYYYVNDPEVVITGSKGCVRDCSFCDIGHFWKKYVYRNGTKLADDLFNVWKQTGVRKFDFSDSLINGSLKNFRLFNQRMIELKNQNPDFDPVYKGQFICRPVGQMKYKDYEEMKRAGCETLVVGIEHFSHEVRKHMRKDFDNHAIDWHFETCARLGIKNTLLMLCGYITETKLDHQITLDHLKKYQVLAMSKIISTVAVSVEGLKITKGAPLYDLLHHEYPNLEFKDKFWIYPQNPDLTPHERARRGAELILTAANLGYNVAHFDQRMSELKRFIDILEKKPPKKLFALELT